jgi:hypothetical protein
MLPNRENRAAAANYLSTINRDELRERYFQLLAVMPEICIDNEIICHIYQLHQQMTPLSE